MHKHVCCTMNSEQCTLHMCAFLYICYSTVHMCGRTLMHTSQLQRHPEHMMEMY